MGLYTWVVTVEATDDAEAEFIFGDMRTYLDGYSERVADRHYRDEAAEGLAAFAGVTWGGR